jgi:tetratricopeptide (TPR) repeat protein
MRQTSRLVLMLAIGAILAVAGVRIFHLMLAEADLEKGNVDATLAWLPNDPEALLKRAEALLAEKRTVPATITAKELLVTTPTDGRGYRVLAQVAEIRGQHDLARKMFGIAARRAPRDLAAHAWLAQDALGRGAPQEALLQIDHVLTLSPGTGANVFPVLVRLSADPPLADALADVLRRRPVWRAGMLNALQSAPAEDRVAADQVLSALQRKGGFSKEESNAWIQTLLRNGSWGEAYARWAAPLLLDGKPLPLLFNGDFASEPSDDGFDWLMPVTPGVILDFEPGSGGGKVLHARFLGRRVVGSFLAHRLLLPPGSYKLNVRQRAEALRSDLGSAWTVTCEGKSSAEVESEGLGGTRSWASTSNEFTVPAQGCQRQMVRMGNAGATEAGQLVSGDLWVEAAKIERVAGN